jgi:putative iron-dependent peroxidase
VIPARGPPLDPKPPTSRVARTDQDRFGKNLRRDIAYGSVAVHGTIFVGFCAEQSVHQAMLESMVGAHREPPDAVTAFTRPLTGAHYVIPARTTWPPWGSR